MGTGGTDAQGEEAALSNVQRVADINSQSSSFLALYCRMCSWLGPMLSWAGLCDCVSFEYTGILVFLSWYAGSIRRAVHGGARWQRKRG
jgi:hypothetical protein